MVAFLHYAGLNCRLSLLYCDAEGAPSRARRVKCWIGLTAALTAAAALAVFTAAVVTGGLTAVGLLTYGLLSVKWTYLSGAIGIACMVIARRIFGDLKPYSLSPSNSPSPSNRSLHSDAILNEAEVALNTWSAEIVKRREILLHTSAGMSYDLIHLIEEYEGMGNEISAQIKKAKETPDFDPESQPSWDRTYQLSKRLVEMCFQYGFMQCVRNELGFIKDVNFSLEHSFKYDAIFKEKKFLAERNANLTEIAGLIASSSSRPDIRLRPSDQNYLKFEAIFNDTIEQDDDFASLKLLSIFYTRFLFGKYFDQLHEMQIAWMRRQPIRSRSSSPELLPQCLQRMDKCVEHFVHELWQNKVRREKGGQDVQNGKRALRQLFKEILDIARHSHEHEVDNFSNEVLKKIKDDLDADDQFRN